MSIYDLPATDKRAIFGDGVLVSVLKDGESVPYQARTFPSMIGMVEDTDGIEIGADDRKFTFDYEDPTINAKKLSEGDQITITNKDNESETYRVKKIARDVTLGLWLCDCRNLKDEATAGIITRRSTS